MDYFYNRPIKCQLQHQVTGNLRRHVREWKRCGAPDWIVSAISNGIPLKFIDGKWPRKHHNANNSIPANVAKWTDDAIKEMLHFKAIRVAKQCPHVVCPILVTLKPSSTPENPKYRLCHNLRYVNKHLGPMPFKLDTVKGFGDQLSRNDSMINIDMESGYFHAEIEEKFRCLLGFKYKGRYYEFIALPFGLSISAFYFQSFSFFSTHSIAQQFHLKFLTYIDDLAFAKNHLPKATVQRILQRLRDFGWFINQEKSCLLPSTCITSLGFVVDSAAMVYRVPEKRLTKFLSAASQVHGRPNASARALQRVAGHIGSLSLALGIVCRLRCRYLLACCQSACVSGRWDDPVPISSRARAEIDWWLDHIRDLRPQPIHAFARKPDFRMSADASDSAQAAWLERTPEGSCNIPIRRSFSAAECRLGSMLRELIGYRDSLRWLVTNYNVTGRVILLIGDALSAVMVFRKGGSQQQDLDGSLPVLEVVLDMYNLLWRHKASLILHWRPRRFLTRADALSKVVDAHDFSIQPSILKKWFPFVSYDVDVFASFTNKKCSTYFSQFNESHSSGWDAFTQDWGNLTCLWIPPFSQSLLPLVLDKIQRDRAQGILVIPVWSKQLWYRRLFSQMSDWIRYKEMYAGSAVIANNSDCFFGSSFDSNILVLWIVPP